MQTIDKLPHVGCRRKIIAQNISASVRFGRSVVFVVMYIEGGGAGSDMCDTL